MMSNAVLRSRRMRMLLWGETRLKLFKQAIKVEVGLMPRNMFMEFGQKQRLGMDISC